MTGQCKVLAIIVAGGSGLRFGGEMPKQYCDLDGRPVVMHTIEQMRLALQRLNTDGPASVDDNVILAIHPDCQELWQKLCLQHHFRSPRVVFGGATRWQTVSNALQSIPESFDGIILIHDAARPIINPQVVKDLVAAVEEGCDGAVPAVKVTDSLRQVAECPDTAGSKAVDRNLFRAVQTPQAFDSGRLRQAYSLPYQTIMTDDASVMEIAGFNRIALVEGDERTLKITHPADIATVAYYLRNY